MARVTTGTTIDVGEGYTTLTRMVAEHRSTTHSPQQRLHFFLSPSVNTALVMRSRWKRWIKVVLVCRASELLLSRKPRRSYPLQTHCFSLKQDLKLVAKIFRITKHDVDHVVRGHIARTELKCNPKRTLGRQTQGVETDASTCESSVASFGCEHGRTSFKGVEVHDVSLPGGSARARS